MENKVPRCYNCKFFAMQDSGYSNWTVQETDISCLKKHFETVEQSYSWVGNEEHPELDDPFYKQAENCPDYKSLNGEMQIHLDVDGETTIEDYKEDTELYEAAKAFYNEQ